MERKRYGRYEHFVKNRRRIFKVRNKEALQKLRA
jgi:hypothetical protein